MKVIENVKMAGRNLKKRKGRTFLTALGVIIGIGAVLTIISLSTGLQDINHEAFSKMGDIRNITVMPSQSSGGMLDLTKDGIKEDELAALEAIDGVKAVLPDIQMNAGMAKVSFSYYESDYNSIIGYLKDKGYDYEFDLLKGRLPERNNEILIGEESYKNFIFTQSGERLDEEAKDQTTLPSSFDFMGRQVTLTQEESTKGLDGDTIQKEKSETFTVVGVLKKEDSTMDMGMGSGAQMYLFSDKVEELNDWYTSMVPTEDNGEKAYGTVNVKVENEQDVDRISSEIESMGYSVFSLNSIIAQVNIMFDAVKIILGGIAAIALLVATINIMNTMYMSVLERNKEIGVMKVLGAPISAIRQMFLCEAGFIGFTGGLIGIIFGELVTYLLGGVLASSISGSGDPIVFPFKFDPALIIGLLLISTIIGMLAGFLPANKAAKISPLEAIRNE